MTMEKPIDTKIGIKPVFVQLIHSGPYEGPCRVGDRKSLEPETEREQGKQNFNRFVGEFNKYLSPDARLLEPVCIEWKDDFVLPEEELGKLESDLEDVDLFVVSGGLTQYPAITIAHRHKKPIAMVGAIGTVDVAAYLRARGLEGYAPLDFDELNRLISLLRVRKAIRNTKMLVALEGDIIPLGVVSSIWNLEDLRERFGVEHISLPAETLFEEMEKLPQEDARKVEQLTDKLIQNADKVHMSRENLLPSVKFYIAAKKVMEDSECNAFVIPCFEICARRIAEEKKVMFCLMHTLFKDEGYPSACEGDINVLMAMTLLMYTSKKSAHMGNSYIVDREKNIVAVHHDVPGLKMKGLAESDLPYEIRNFTFSGWGATIRYDFSLDIGQPVTLARFDPRATELLVVKGEIAGGGGFDEIGCSLRAHIKVKDAVELLHKEVDFGHHLAMVYGDYSDDLKELGKMMKFDVVEA
jgi:L-fucose isomerase-like protein